MLKDWLWSITVTIGVWLEVLAIALPLGKRLKLRPLTANVLAAACLSQVYFAASLVGARASVLHVLLLCAAALFVITRRSNAGEPKLHLKIARSLSPMSWARAWPWLVLPAVWMGLRFVDALVPHPNATPLAINLNAAHRWFEDGRQIIDPLNPIAGGASVWDGLYFHLQAIFHAIGRAHRPSLVRAQIASQLLHFTLGQCLALWCAADLVLSTVRNVWGTHRHQGMPAALCLAWIAVGQGGTAGHGVLALNDWGAAALWLGGLLLVLDERFFLGWFVLATAFATQCSLLVTLPAIALLTGLSIRARPARALLGLALGLATWLARNLLQTGSLFFPWNESLSTAGWMPHGLFETILADRTFAIEGLVLELLMPLGAIALVVVCVGQKFRLAERKVLALAFVLVMSLPIAIFWGRYPLALVTAATLGTLVGLLILLAVSALKMPPWFTRGVPHAWLIVGLFCVPLPFHVLWQHLGYAFTPPEQYLENELLHYPEKHWAALQLPLDARIAWTSDNQFYYLPQPSTAIPEATAVRDPLSHAQNPRERARILCDLGFQVLAWEDHRHGPEVTGLSSWLRVTKAPVLYSTEDVTLYKLACDKP